MEKARFSLVEPFGMEGVGEFEKLVIEVVTDLMEKCS
jgi:hypothetical protein